MALNVVANPISSLVEDATRCIVFEFLCMEDWGVLERVSMTFQLFMIHFYPMYEAEGFRSQFSNANKHNWVFSRKIRTRQLILTGNCFKPYTITLKFPIDFSMVRVLKMKYDCYGANYQVINNFEDLECLVCCATGFKHIGEDVLQTIPSIQLQLRWSDEHDTAHEVKLAQSIIQSKCTGLVSYTFDGNFDENVALIIAKHENIHHLKLRGDESMITTLADCCPNLRSVNLKYPIPRFKHAVLLLNQCQHLERVTFYQSVYYDKQSRNLYVRMNVYADFEDHESLKIFLASHSLETVEFSHLSLDDSVISALVTGSSQSLVKFNTGLCFDVSPICLNTMISTCVNLTHFRLQHRTLKDEDVTTIFPEGNGLKDIKVAFGKVKQLQSIVDLIKRCNHLKRLSVELIPFDKCPRRVSREYHHLCKDILIEKYRPTPSRWFDDFLFQEIEVGKGDWHKFVDN